ncbi:GGDEF domain-containing protein [Actinoplanes sp. NPDC049118]|uniref:GGDEF domain-containing protein n=1 Tax=Actinoplanes sp. NPDC049118 TaxID=3155769 RepID=UPI0033C9EFDD
MSAAEVSAALLAIEDEVIWDAEAGARAAAELEQRAVTLGDETLIARARLCLAILLLRGGDIAGGSREIYDIHEWAARHGDRILRARTHSACANIARLSGEEAKCLEHSLSAVELLDETASPYVQIRHQTKLADALARNGAIGAARLRFRQAEVLAGEAQQWDRLRIVLNNWAYAEHNAGDFPRAQDVARRLVEHADAHGVELDPTELDTIGAIQIANGEYVQAEQTMHLCIARYEAGLSDDADDLAEFLLTLARAQRGLGATARAQASLDASRALCRQRDLHQIMVRVHEEQAELHAGRGDYAQAFAAQKECFAAQESLRSRQGEAQAQSRYAMFETAEALQDAERFREQARRDPLTGLRNRRYVDEHLPALIVADPALAVAIADIDHFKRINDELSHDVGDRVLVQVADLLEAGLAAVAPRGFVVRLGGEEFLLVLPATPVALATAKLDGIRQAVGDHDWRGLTGGLPLTVSIGVADLSESSPPSLSAALSAADRNLYAAKHQGRNRVVAGTPPEPRARAYRDRLV